MNQLIFHQHSRYSLVKAVIDKNRIKKSYTILEVGSGAHKNLADFLPDDQITFLDLELPEEVLSDPRFMIGDATALPFEDSSIDYIIGLDVLEHVPVEKRHAFLEEAIRVSREGVVLTFPHAHAVEDVDDNILREFYKLMTKYYPIWLDEHIDCSLPSWEQVVAEIHQINSDIKVHHFYQAERHLMSSLLRWEALASAHPETFGLFGAVNDQYCNEYFWDDFCDSAEQSTKTWILIDKCNKLDNVDDMITYRQDRILQFRLFAENLFVATLNLVNSLQINQLELAQDAQRSVLTKLKCCLIPHDTQNEWEIIDNIRNPSVECDPDEWSTQMDVLLICYNQSDYIEQTLDSILAQQTHGFRYRVVVADDASKDDTIEKIQRMAEKSDVEFLILPHDHNHGIMQNYKRGFVACTSKYVAVMEGDDLWTDPLRLQKHFHFLEEHSECAMSFNCYEVRNFDTGDHHVQPIVKSEMPYTIYGGGDIACDNLIGNFSTCVYRKEILDQLPEEMYTWKGFDWITNLMISRLGCVGCLHDVMNIYRIHKNGVWSGQDQKQQIHDLIEIIDEYDKKLAYVYHDGFAAHKKRLKKMLMPAAWHKTKYLIRRVYYKLKRISRFCPPIFIYLLKMLIPEAIRDKLRG